MACNCGPRHPRPAKAIPGLPGENGFVEMTFVGDETITLCGKYARYTFTATQYTAYVDSRDVRCIEKQWMARNG